MSFIFVILAWFTGLGIGYHVRKNWYKNQLDLIYKAYQDQVKKEVELTRDAINSLNKLVNPSTSTIITEDGSTVYCQNNNESRNPTT